MCRSRSEGGRRCPGDGNREAAAARQRRSRANRGLAAAAAAGDSATAAVWQQRLTEADAALAQLSTRHRDQHREHAHRDPDSPTTAAGGGAAGHDTAAGQITAAYRSLVAYDGDWVRLADLRERIGASVPRDQLDAALRQLSRGHHATVIPEQDLRRLTDADHAAAVRLGGEAKHLIAFGADGPGDPGLGDPAPGSGGETTGPHEGDVTSTGHRRRR